MALVSDQSRTNTIINNTGFIRSGLGNWYQINQEPIQSLTIRVLSGRGWVIGIRSIKNQYNH